MHRTPDQIAFEKTDITRSDLEQNLLLPVALILILVSLLSAMQEYFIFFKGIHSGVNFFLHYVSKFIYFFFFIPLGMLLKYYSRKINFSRKDLPVWIVIHLSTLISILYLHQLLAFTTDKILFSETYKSTFYMVLYTNPAVWADLIIYILCLLGFSLINSRKKSRENEIHFTKLEMELVKTKLFELRSKIHPQFLFNTLNTMSRLVQTNQNKEANKVLSKLSDFLRTTVYDSEREEITIEEELTFLNQYLDIERISFGNELVVNENIEPDIKNALVPNFILQPIIEGLLYQNINGNSSSIELSINSWKVEEQLHVEIKFLHSSFSAILFQNSQSIELANDHLKQLYSDNYSFQYHSDEDEKLTIIVVLPYHEKVFESEVSYVIEDPA